MNFYDVINERTSIKSFKNTPIEKDKLNRVIESAMMSPSWKNNSSYRFILVDNEGEKAILANSVMNSIDSPANGLVEAPLIAVVIAQPDESGEIGSKDYYLVDSAIAMEHFILAATNEGYGTCWIASFDESRVKELLNIPEAFRVVAMTPVGVPAENPNHHLEKDTSEYIFLNQFGQSYE